MSDVRPSGGDRDGAAELLASARARLAAAVADLQIDDEFRLSDWQRTAVANLLGRLVRGIEDELRAGLHPGTADAALHAALTSAHVEIAMPILAGAGSLADGELVGALLRRAEEHRLHRAGTAETALLVELAGDEDIAIAEEAMGLLIAQASRLDAFQEPLLPRTDLPAELGHRLVWTVAAALRRYMTERHGVAAPAADAAVAAAASALLSGWDEGETIDARCARLARALREAGRLDDAVTARALTEASLPLFAAMLAVRAGLHADAVWELLFARSASGTVFLLRAAGIARAETGAILLSLGFDEEALAPQLDLFDATGPDEASDRLVLWRADPGYRAALAKLVA